MQYLGDYAEDYATLNFKFSTHKADGTPIALAGTPAVSVYKGNGAEQSTAGITLTVDFDSVTGLNNVLIDLSADAFYAVGNDYSVVITTGTVNSISVVGTVLAHFSIENRFSSGLDAAGVRTAIGLASANLDTQLSTIDTNVDAILVDTGTTIPALISQIDTNSGAGKVPVVITITKDSIPQAGAEVWVTSDIAGNVIIRSGHTNDLGKVTFNLDAGTYYAWADDTLTDFSNPTVLTVAEE